MKRKTMIGILTIIFLLLIVSSVIVGLYKKPFSSHKPEKLLLNYVACIEKGSYEKMYGMLTDDSKKNISKKDFVERNQKIYEGIEAQNLAVKVKKTEKTNLGVMVYYEMSLDSVAGKIQFTNEALYTRASMMKAYKLSWSDQLIFPELKEGDRVTVQTTEAIRGRVEDRNGVMLAGLGSAKNVGFVPRDMSPDATVDTAQLAELLGISTEQIQSALAADWVGTDMFVPIKTISNEDYVRLKDQLLAIPGVLVDDIQVRAYPLGEKAAHLIGYVQKVTAEDLEEHKGEGYTSTSVIGRSGIESLYEKRLRGQNGVKISILLPVGVEGETLAYIEQKDGETISLTIDASLQSQIYDQYQADKSASVAMNPHTGEVLALVSTPAFNGNEFILGMSDDRWTQLNSDASQPLYNRFRQVWSPGSVFKPIVAGMGLDAGVINPDEDYGSSGLSWQKDESWGDYRVTTLQEYAPAILEHALIYSDNIYFAKAALAIGTDGMMQSLDKLGFNQELPFEIKVNKSLYANENGKIDSDIQLADSGYGQGQILMNPLHLAALYTGLVNEGNVVKPYLEYKETPVSEVWIPGAFTVEAAARVKTALEKVVNSPEGTGYGAHRTDMTLAGKTGTAEIKVDQNDTTGTELGWFGVFTVDPSAKKPILIMSMVEDVKDRGGSGYVVDKSTAVLQRYLYTASE